MENNYILITGSNKGLGKELALIFAKNNYNIILHGRNDKDIQDVKKEVIKNGVDCCFIKGDLIKDNTLERLHKISREKNISVLINNAGIHCPYLPLEKLSDKQIDDLILINLIAPLKLTKRVYADFLEKNSGTIININSLSGLKPQYLRTLYCASKWGLKGFSDAFRLEAKNNNVRVIEVYPGRIKTREEFKDGMDPSEVAQKIYTTFINKKTDTIELYGEKK